MLPSTYVAPRPGPFEALIQATEIGGFALEPLLSTRVRDRFYDTDDGVLLRTGLAVRVREQDGVVTVGLRALDGRPPRGLPRDLVLRSAPGDGINLEGSPFAPAVRAATGTTRLRSLLSLRQYRTPRIATENGRHTALVSFDVVVYEGAGSQGTSNEVEVERTGDGTPEDLERLGEALCERGLEPSHRTTFERGVLRLPRSTYEPLLLLPDEARRLADVAEGDDPALARRARAVLLDARGFRADTIAGRTGLSAARAAYWKSAFRERRMGILSERAAVETPSLPLDPMPPPRPAAPLPAWSAPPALPDGGAPAPAAPPVAAGPRRASPPLRAGDAPPAASARVEVDGALVEGAGGAAPPPKSSDDPRPAPATPPEVKPGDREGGPERSRSSSGGAPASGRTTDAVGPRETAPGPDEPANMDDLLDLFRLGETSTPLLRDDDESNAPARPPRPAPASPRSTSGAAAPAEPSRSAPPRPAPRAETPEPPAVSGDTPVLVAVSRTVATHVDRYEAASRAFESSGSVDDARRFVAAARGVRLALLAFRWAAPEHVADRLVGALRPLVIDLDAALDYDRAASEAGDRAGPFRAARRRALASARAGLRAGRGVWSGRAQRLVARLHGQGEAGVPVGDDVAPPLPTFVGPGDPPPGPTALRHVLGSMLWDRYEAVRAFEGGAVGDRPETAEHFADALRALRFLLDLATGASDGPALDLALTVAAAEERVLAERDRRRTAGLLRRPSPPPRAVASECSALTSRAFRDLLARVAAGI